MQSFFEAYPANSGRLQFAPPFPDYVEDVVLAAGVLQRIPLPVGTRFAIFSFDGNVRLKLGVADTLLALPVATSSGGDGSELNPTARRVTNRADGTPFTHLCLRAAAGCSGSISFYA